MRAATVARPRDVGRGRPRWPRVVTLGAIGLLLLLAGHGAPGTGHARAQAPASPGVELSPADRTALVRGLDLAGDGRVSELIRPPEEDLFR